MGKRSRKKGSQGGNDKQTIGSIASPKKAELYRCARELAILTSINFLEENDVSVTYSKVEKLVLKIINLERELGAGAKILSNSPRSKHFPELIDWVKENGGNLDAVSIEEYPGFECGLRAEQDISEGALLCSIPRKVMMLVDDPNSDINQFITSDPMLMHMDNIGLVMFLLDELSKGSQSFWAPYINSLPKTYNTVLYFTSDEIALLKGSPTQKAAMSQNIHIARQYSYFHEICKQSEYASSRRINEIFSYETYRWAVSTVLTRQNVIPNGKNMDEKLASLIPVWDMCNHMSGPITTGYNSETACCDSFAPHSINKGQQVFISYAARPNSEFFLHNALVPDENPDDYYCLHLGLARTDPQIQSVRAALLQKLGLPCGGNFYLRPGPGPVEYDLLAFIRVFCMDQASLEHWLESGRWNDLKCLDCALETQIETKAWKFLATRISLLLSVYPTLPELAENASIAMIKKLIESEKILLNSALENARLKAEH